MEVPKVSNYVDETWMESCLICTVNIPKRIRMATLSGDEWEGGYGGKAIQVNLVTPAT